MDPSSIILIFVLIILLALSAFFSSAETALTTVNKIRIRSLAEEGSKKADTVLQLIDNPSRLLSTILVGNNIVNLSASSIATTLATDMWGSIGAGIATGALTFLILIFGEITPKSLATMHSEKISLFYAGAINILIKVLKPIVIFINAFSNGLLKLLRIDPNASAQAITESELRTIVDVSHEEGVIESEERKMINNVFDFGDSLAKDIMIPRVDMVYASINATYEELLTIYMEEQYTRLPVYSESKDNVIGILNIKDLFFYRYKNKGSEFDISKILRTPNFSYEFQKTSELLAEMKKAAINITIVLDEYGAAAGIITLEDLLEEIVGEIRDEYDESEAETIKLIRKNQYAVDGATKIDDLNDVIGTNIESVDYDSVGGHIIELLSHIPEENEIATEENITYKVLSIDKNRINRVLITVTPPVEPNTDNN